MRTLVLVPLLVAISLVAGGVRRAEACGSWTMADVEKKLAVHYTISSALISKLTKQGKPGKRVAAQYFTDEKQPLRVVTGKRVVLDIKDGKLVQGGKSIGTIEDSRITIGDATYVVELGSKVEHPLPSWTLRVSRGDTLVIESDRASSMCQHALLEGDVAAQQDDIRRRIAFYLAWRHTAGRRL
jgi:hypothetical protein